MDKDLLYVNLVYQKMVFTNLDLK